DHEMALADGEHHGVFLPPLVRNLAGSLAGKIEPRRRAEPHRAAPSADRFHADAAAHFIVVAVAGLLERLVQGHLVVHPAELVPDPAIEVSPSLVEFSPAEKHLVRPDELAFETGDRRHDLEERAGRELILEGATEQRLAL